MALGILDLDLAMGRVLILCLACENYPIYLKGAMVIFIRSLFALILSVILSSAAFAQDASSSSDLTINDIAGHWRIEVIDRPNDDFKGTAMIPRAKSEKAKTIMAETITEDKCCGGVNHARVLQDSRITISSSGKITVDSKIRKYLLKIEGTSAQYYPDDFQLRWKDSDTLIGTANGYTPIRWVRDVVNLS